MVKNPRNMVQDPRNMVQDLQKASDLFFDTVTSGYDPLLDDPRNNDATNDHPNSFEVDDEDIDESGGQLGPHTEYQAKVLYASRPDDRPASQRIEDLFADLAPRRRILLAILGFLNVPKRSAVLEEKVEELQKNDFSVYSGHNFSTLLEEAGAIRKVNEDGSDFDEEAEQLPDIVEVGDAKFYKPTDGKQVFWIITDEGHVYLKADDPFDRLTELIAEEPQYQTLYKSMLKFCGCEKGRSAEELSDLIDNDPLVQKPRKTFSYFAKKLEDCSALVWAKSWHTTELGKSALERLFSEDEGSGYDK